MHCIKRFQIAENSSGNGMDRIKLSPSASSIWLTSSIIKFSVISSFSALHGKISRVVLFNSPQMYILPKKFTAALHLRGYYLKLPEGFCSIPLGDNGILRYPFWITIFSCLILFRVNLKPLR